ncbi:LysR family transcriptional regulator [Croceicoccus naphthovorans]|uniref:LysR family transcriptional regulator n=1 Tax=Croceicoccus naphthovorans TaxID=1348774 RepID=A0A0G3XD44_9SPHN|nr:LysR family transcriptional regulator [Croceicoccus naphthovorans]AKM09077.1 LysR family transcriptional regulator [Croceicoccus naphthovorans]MBB3992158.1 DNA-binding transcriptional LysR family regulator [Croceicoccus naphthovorans]
MDISSLSTFLAAADTGSFTAAAQRVHVSPSTVTERIKQLEHRLGVVLFERDKRGCRLTLAGRKLLGPASQAVRAIDIARHEVGLPERFRCSLSFGAQYVLWNDGLLDWLAQTRGSLPDVAWRVTSGASARLNRDLAEGFLDFVLLYDPVFRPDIGSMPLFEDELILVTAGSSDTWRKDYVRIEWGRDLGVEIASRLDLAPESGLLLDLGERSADWLVKHAMAGYMPARSVASRIEAGELSRVNHAPRFHFPAYACWRRDMDESLLTALLESLKNSRICAE